MSSEFILHWITFSKYDPFLPVKGLDNLFLEVFIISIENNFLSDFFNSVLCSFLILTVDYG